MYLYFIYSFGDVFEEPYDVHRVNNLENVLIYR